MPFKSNKRYRKRRYRKKNTTKALSKRITKVYKLCKPETKIRNFDSGTTGITFATSTALYYPLCALAQGATSADRIGDKATFKWFSGSILFHVHTNSYTVRVILVNWIPNDGASFSLSTLLHIVGDDRVMTSGYKISEAGNFKILMDKVIQVSDSERVVKVRRSYNILTEYTTAIGTQADIKRNNLVFCLMPAASANGAKAFYHLRSRFVDS